MEIKYNNIEISTNAKFFIEQTLAEYDSIEIEEIVVKHSKSMYSTGVCKYPIKRLTEKRKRAGWTKADLRQKFKIICRVGNYRYPYTEHMYTGTRFENGLPVETFSDKEVYENKDHAFIWLFGHELFHFLRKTKQIGGQNTQSQANRFGFKLLREYKEFTNGN